MRYLAKYLKPYRRQCVVGPICKLIEAILELILPTIMAYMINDGVVHQDRSVVARLGILMIAMVFIGFGFSMVCQYNAALASQGFGTDMRNLMFAHIQKFSYQDIEHFGTSSLVNRLSNDINQLQLAVAMLIRLVIRSPFIVIGAVVMAMFLDFRLSLILLAAVPFIGLILFLFIRFSTPLYKIYQKKLDKFASILQDYFSGIRVIRAFVSQKREKKRVMENINDLQAQMMKVARLSALLNPCTALVINGAVIILLYQGAFQIQSGVLEPGTIVAFINYASSILIALVALSNLIVIFTKAGASAQRVKEVLQYEPTMEEGRETIAPEEKAHMEDVLQFAHVSFSYGDGEEAVTDIDFKIRRGETIGIIGGTGAGKTTLVNLLCRFYDPGRGAVKLYGRELPRLRNEEIRRCISVVPQVNELFYGTIRENIAFGREDTSDEDILQALEDAQASEFIRELPKKLDTIVERGGANFSGGQRQRLCIARALLRRPDILILDDSSSALDFKTDAGLRHAIRDHLPDTTKIIVSQRVGTLLACDRILVMKDGKAAGFANHSLLFDTCQAYRDICDTQEIGKEGAV